MSCGAFCFLAALFAFPAAAQYPFTIDDCGILTSGGLCRLLFQSDHHGLYELTDYGDFQWGDHVRVRGRFVRDRVSICMTGQGWIETESIGWCDSCACALHGDCTHDGRVDHSDVVYLINYAFLGGRPPPQYAACPVINRGDWDCDERVVISDIVRMVNYLYRYPAPGPCDPCAR